MLASTALANPSPAASAPDFATLIRQKIEQRLGQAITDLTVATESNRIIVRGCAESFYDWQRVQSVCRQVLDVHSGFGLDCAMSVPHVYAVSS